MCREEGNATLQRGMNFRLRNGLSVILMSLRPNSPYADRVEENGRVLIYEGHDVPRIKGGPEPKTVSQPMCNPTGSPTQNGLFYQAAVGFKQQNRDPELVKVYEKVRSGTWTYNGVFKLVDAWQEKSDNRQVFKFKLELVDEMPEVGPMQLDHNRIIPASVKVEVWKRDKGCCVQCGSKDNLHFDHIIPYSKGGSSLVAENIQLLCVRHNLAKRDKIE
jgi:hypothetical protein